LSFLGPVGCQTKQAPPQSNPAARVETSSATAAPAPPSAPAAPAASAIEAAPRAAALNGVADRPEKLSFPPLAYEPPQPEKYRVTLKSGPIAYVVPDRELPLVNIVVYVHTGEYVQPEGKEGLASLTGYLLARGGTKSKTAE